MVNHVYFYNLSSEFIAFFSFSYSNYVSMQTLHFSVDLIEVSSMECYEMISSFDRLSVYKFYRIFRLDRNITGNKFCCDYSLDEIREIFRRSEFGFSVHENIRTQ